MTAYDALNGVPCTVNDWLLRKVLRGDWGFDGYIVSDCGAPANVVREHHFVEMPETAAKLCVEAGLDLECGGDIYTQPLKDAFHQNMVFAEMQMGRTVEWCKDVKLDDISAKMVFEAADAGDKLARKVVQISSEFMGRGLSMIIDILNPEVIVLGGIFMRSEGSIRPYLEKVIAEEALPLASAVCVIRPAALGESVGDIAALSVATQG